MDLTLKITRVTYSPDQTQGYILCRKYGPCVRSQPQSGLTASRINLSPFTKDFRAVGHHYRHLYFSVVLIEDTLLRFGKMVGML